MKKSSLHIRNDQKINASLIFFVVNSCQIGVGIHGFQRLVVQHAKQDAWISILLSFIIAHFTLFIMLQTLKMFSTEDLYGIHQEIFGTIIGNFFNVLYILYCSFVFFAILRNYIEVINTWVFPDLSPIFLSITFFILIIYSFTGGLRVMIGICFFCFFFTFWVPFVLLLPLEYAHSYYLLPILDTDIIELLKGAQVMSFTIVGFEIINVLYPFVKDNEKKKVQKYAHLGLLATLFLYLSVMLVSLSFFSVGQLERTVWATLTLFSIIKLPFIERIEIITICFWMIIILPNLCLYAWAAYRGIIRLINVKETKFIWSFSFFIFLASISIQSRTRINEITSIISQISFYIIFVYPILLYILAVVKKSLKKGKN